MKITTYLETKDILVQTVTLAHNKQNPQNVYLFRCYRCGNPITQIKGKVTKIFPGIEPTLDVVVINRCTTCRELYTFQTTPSLKVGTTITLSTYPDDKFNIFRCYICRNVLLEFTDTQVWRSVSHLMLTLPYRLVCNNPLCQEQFNIVDISKTTGML